MKKYFLAAAAVTALASSVPASAQLGDTVQRGLQNLLGGGMNARLSALDNQIRVSLQNGEITRSQASRLNDELVQLRQLDRTYRAGGLTRMEREELDQRLMRLERRIQEARSGDGDRYDRNDRDNNGRYGSGIPYGHMPPAGQCRVWYQGRPAGHQPPPTSCSVAERQASANGGRVIYGTDRDRDRDDRWDDRRDGDRNDRDYRDNDYRQDYRRNDGLADFENDRLLRRWALSNFDMNRDGMLSAQEARSASAAFQNAADSNRDGRVSQVEYDRARMSLARR